MQVFSDELIRDSKSKQEETTYLMHHCMRMMKSMQSMDSMISRDGMKVMDSMKSMDSKDWDS